MSLRPEEIFVRDRLLDVLESSGDVAFSEGEDPPDLVLRRGNKQYAVEVTRLTPVTFGEDGGVGNRMTDDSFGAALCDSLNESMGQDVAEGYSLLLTLYLPVLKPKEYREALKERLCDTIIPSGPFMGRCEYQLKESKIEVSWIPLRPSGKRIVGILRNVNVCLDILHNAKVILCRRILAKEKRYTELNLDIPRWLALYNDYFLADSDTLAQAYHECGVKHGFQRIYAVNTNGAVRVLLDDT